MMIKTPVLFLSSVVLLVSLITCPDSSIGQKNASPQAPEVPPKILAFLKKMEPKVRFQGEVIPLPEDLRKSLEQVFYLHRFTIVVAYRSLDISYMRSAMIIVTNAKSGEVISFMWHFFSSPPAFKEILSQYPERHDWEEAAGQIKLFADLVLYPAIKDEGYPIGRVGCIRYDAKQKVFSAELILKYIPSALLRIQVEEVDQNYKFGSLSFIDAETSKEK